MDGGGPRGGRGRGSQHPFSFRLEMKKPGAGAGGPFSRNLKEGLTPDGGMLEVYLRYLCFKDQIRSESKGEKKPKKQDTIIRKRPK